MPIHAAHGSSFPSLFYLADGDPAHLPRAPHHGLGGAGEGQPVDVHDGERRHRLGHLHDGRDRRRGWNGGMGVVRPSRGERDASITPTNPPPRSSGYDSEQEQ